MPNQTHAFKLFRDSLEMNRIVTNLTMGLVNYRALEVQAIEGSLVDPANIRLKPNAPADALENLAGIEERLNRTWNEFVSGIPGEVFVTAILAGYMSRSVDIYNAYITQILAGISAQHPSALSRTHQNQLSTKTGIALDSEIERIAGELAKGFGNAIGYLRRNANLQYDTTAADYNAAKEYIDVRNLYVHNGGFVNVKFLRITGRTDLKADDPFPLTPQYISNGMHALLSSVESLDTAIIAAIGLT